MVGDENNHLQAGIMSNFISSFLAQYFQVIHEMSDHCSHPNIVFYSKDVNLIIWMHFDSAPNEFSPEETMRRKINESFSPLQKSTFIILSLGV